MPTSRKLPPRYAGLTKALNGLSRSLPTDAPRQSKLARKRTIRNLLGRLDVFGRKQLEFFQRHFKPSDTLTEYLISGTEDQIGNDLEVIERTADQRRRHAPPIYHESLNRADGLACAALMPAKEAFPAPDEQTVLTYFQKEPAIRVIPYAPVALIGMPFTILTVSTDYLAIPHEVGHYVYRHGRLPRESAHGGDAGLRFYVALEGHLKERLKESPAKWWVGEIFADVYGCAIGGPVMAIDFQDLQLNRSPEEFTADDEEHPVPMLRPEAYHRALEKMGLDGYAEAARERWEKLLKGRGNEHDYNQAMEVRAAIAAVVDQVWELLKTLGQVADPWPAPTTAQWPIPHKLPAATNRKLDAALYQAFRQAVGRFRPGQFPPPEVKPAKSDPNLTKLQERFIREAERAAEVFGQASPPEYLDVLVAEGWTTEENQHPWP